VANEPLNIRAALIKGRVGPHPGLQRGFVH
jgi:hypothetical protein